MDELPPSEPFDEVALDPALEDAILAALGADAEPVLAVVERADALLAALLLPRVPGVPLPDRTGEDVRVDLLDADIWLEGSELVGTVHGTGADENGVWVVVDVGGGPAPDLELGFGRQWSRERTLHGAPSPALARDVMPEVEKDRVSFRADLSGSQLFEPGHVGYAVASVKSFDGTIRDEGPGGLLGEPGNDRIEVLAALVASGPVSDADLAVALAVTFGTIRPVVADEVVPLVEADALAWLRYGESLDGWLEAGEAQWRLGSQDALGKLVWAWPAAQAVAYGQFALSVEEQRLSEAKYRFVVPSVATLEALRAMVPVRGDLVNTTTAVDRWTWERLRYRANDALMTTLCHNGGLDSSTCKGWQKERGELRPLGVVDGVKVPTSEGVSASYQLEVLAREGQFVGDCATATALSIAAMQALGIPAVGMGWAGDVLASPTHDVPMWFDGQVFRPTQGGPGRDWNNERAFVYVTLPGVHPVAYSMGSEPNGWRRGGAVAGGWTTFGEVDRILREGLPASIVGDWVDVQAAGGWPTW